MVQDHIQDTRYEETYDSLVLSPGATPIVPEIKGLAYANCYSLRSFKDMLKLDEHITAYNYTSVCIVGGGFIGLEMAENFKERGLDVQIIQRSDHVLSLLDADLAALVEDELLEQSIHLHKNCTIDQVEKDGKTLHLTNGHTIQADFLLLAVGVNPNTHLAQLAKLPIGDTGGVKVNEFMQTNDPSIYAIGDVIESFDFITKEPKRVPLAWAAHRQAFIAARHINGQPVPFKGLLGTAICKVFTLTAATLGHNEESLKKKNIEFETIVHKANQHAGYYPDAKPFTTKIHFSPTDGKIYGAQSVGQSGVDKRIDVLATAILGGMTIVDLQEIEIAYAPPYSAPKDPINMIGYKAIKKMNTTESDKTSSH